jgi:cobalt-zinc-cadmium efflux system membrane fusion protein
VSDGNVDFVFQQWKDDLWLRRDVTVGRRIGPYVEILSGIEPGATIVTSGAFMFKSDVLREKMGAGCAH